MSPTRPPPSFAAAGLQHRLWFERDDAPALRRQLLQSGRLCAGRLDAVQRFAEQGFVVLRQALPASLLQDCWADLDRAQRDGEPLWCHREGVGVFRSDDAARRGADPVRAAVHDFHNRSASTLRLVTHPGFVPLAAALLGTDPVLMQSQMFRHASGKGLHSDHVYYPIAAPLRTLTVWIAAEAVGPHNGGLLLYPGSHRLPLEPFDDGSWLWPHGEDLQAMQRLHQRWLQRCTAAALVPCTFTAQAGDLLLFDPRLAHGAQAPQRPGASRRSLALHLAATDAYLADHRPLPQGSRRLQAGGVWYHQPNLS